MDFDSTWSSNNAISYEEACGRAAYLRWEWSCPYGLHEPYMLNIERRHKNGTPCNKCYKKPLHDPKESLAAYCPKAMAFWSSKNKLDPYLLARATMKHYIWECPECQHEWTMSPNSLLRREVMCQCCAGKVATPKHNLLTVFPQAKDFWDYDLNTVDPMEVSPRSGKGVRWRCPKCQHRWSSSPHASIDQGTGRVMCGCCANLVLVIGTNDLHSQHSELTKDWDYEANDLSPEQVVAGGAYRASWKCHKCGHKWQNAVCNAVRGHHGCKSCAGQIPSETRNLYVHYPDLCKEWAWDHNDKHPREYTPSSNYSATWRCQKDPRHIWEAVISSRVTGNGCPVCINRAVISGVNDIPTKAAFMLDYWDYENNQVSPEGLHPGSGERVWWKCKKGHSKHAAPAHTFVGKRYACKDCVASEMTSRAEKELGSYIKSIYQGEIIPSYVRDSSRLEIDIYLPELQLGIEFNGVYWHSMGLPAGHKHKRKYDFALSHGIYLVAVWEDDWRYRRDEVEREMRKLVEGKAPQKQELVGPSVAATSQDYWARRGGMQITRLADSDYYRVGKETRTEITEAEALSPDEDPRQIIRGYGQIMIAPSEEG